eukprot:TRINITY_DN1669_c2_g2_i1.p1 TRINITY_DN1669_c2_g2~~TRINITY_DN1669_c2_g2_i1.p1  ORF type:complete len:409 (-),score=77.60 TRINITY_DN1669_c2_g2_i1:87-1313(-)
MAPVPAPASDPFAYTAERRKGIEEARSKAQSYDVYKDFPALTELPAHEYTPTSVLVTGAAGFIASHVTIRLTRLYPQYRVVAIDKISYASDEKNLDSLKDCKNFRFEKMDICDYDAVLKLMQEEKVDTVLHLAAQSHVDLSFKEGGPQQFCIDNVLGTASLLEASRKLGVRRFVHCSTDEVYGEGSFEKRVDFAEDSPMNPNNPYSASKAGADVLAQSFYKSFNFPIVITRGNNVYGPHQFYEKVVPKFIAQLKSGRQLTIHGSGGNTRNFLHVQDTASAFDAIMHCGKIGEAYNIGGKNEKTVLEVAADLLLMLGLDKKQKELVNYVIDRAHNDACYPITNAKLEALGWREKLSWEFGLANTVNWFTAKLNAENRDIAKVLEAHPGHSATDKTFTASSASAAPRSRL